MKHVYSLEEAQLDGPSVVTIGMFDGVHRGHQALVKRLVQAAHESGRHAVVLTFFPHPDVVLRSIQGRYYLTSPEERARLLLELGVDRVITHTFDDSVREMRAADFVDRMLLHLKLNELWVGADFALGYKREGNVDYLRQLGKDRGYEVEIVDLVGVDNNGTKISSSAIRAALELGQVSQVHDWLGRPYTLTGTVVHGDQRGRTIGFPTANIAVWQSQVIPANGVYAGWAQVGDEHYMAVTNVGLRPTFDGTRITVEVHILDFEQYIYEQSISFSFVERLRDEMKFSGIDALTAQLGSDVQAGRELLTARPHP